MKKKRVLFCIRDFNHGGIPKSLENLLALIDKDRYDISIFCAYQYGGGYYKSVFSKYEILPQSWLLYWFCVNYKSLRGWKLIVALAMKTISKLFLKINVDLFDCALKQVSEKTVADKKYDVAVAFAEGWITRFVSYMKAERKVAWIHMDYKRVLSYENDKKDAETYLKFDYIVSPCKFSAESFKDVHPALSDRVVAIKNVLDVYMIKTKSELEVHDINFSSEQFNIVSVGRICYEKQFYEIPFIADRIREKNIDFKWYIIGTGPDAEVAILKENIKKYKVEDVVILLGAKDNPYPYIAKSKLLALLSLSETFSYVAYEAKILGVPIITTDFSAASEIVEDGVGIIAPKELFPEKIMELLEDITRYESMKKSLSAYKYDNDVILSQINRLFS